MQGTVNDLGIIPQCCLNIFANIIEIKLKESATDLISNRKVEMKNKIYKPPLEEYEVIEENSIM